MKVGNSVRYASAAAAVAGLAALGLVAIAGPSALAQTPPPLKIGVMDGFSGVYGDLTAGEVESMQLAIEDVGGKVLDRPVEILSADHQTKPDIGAAIARKWYDVDGVDVIDIRGGGDKVTGDPLEFVLVGTGRADPSALGLDESVNIYG